MKTKLSILLFLVSIVVAAQSFRKYSNEFMNIGVDAAALGMANAVTATTSDVNSAYWNPAGILHLKDNQVSLMHSSYFANIATYNFAAFAMPLDKESAVAFSVIRFGVDDIMNTTRLIDEQGNIDYNRIRLFSAADYAFIFSYARKLPLDGFSYGANAKVIRRIIGEFATSWGFGFDLGIQFEKKDWRFGIMARDVTTTYNIWSIDEDAYAAVQQAVEGQNQELPESTEITIPKLQMGVGRTFEFRGDYTLTAAVNLNMRFAQTNDIISTSAFSIDPAVGFEAGYIEMVFLRAGVGNFQNVMQLDGTESLNFQPNFGVGFKYKGIQVDYALTDIGDQSVALYSNIFSVKVDWGIFRN